MSSTQSPDDFGPYLLRGPRRPVPPGGVLELIADVSRRAPDAIAIADLREMLSYAELERRSTELAIVLGRRLSSHGTARIAVHADASCRFLLVLLAILKAGCTYLPLPKEQPTLRLEAMLEDAEPELVLCDGPPPLLRAPGATVLDWSPLFVEVEAVQAAPTVVHPARRGGAPAYILFTSGTTGRPKGVPIGHRALANRLLWMRDEHGLGPGDSVLQKSSIGFDVSLVELLGTLVSGARLLIDAPGVAADPERLVDVSVRQRVTALVMMPAQLALLLEHPRASELPLRRVFTGGEAFGQALVDAFYARFTQAVLYNGYGPTEATISVTAWRARPGALGSPPLGAALPNVELLVLDDAGRPVAEGGVGELLIGGLCLAEGYLQSHASPPEPRGPEAKDLGRFIELPCDGSSRRFYRSGDRVRRLPHENLAFVGRIDTQVKIRGVRMELEEIERHLEDCPKVKEASVLTLGTDARTSLVGFVTGDVHAPRALESVQEWLRTRLPEVMIPRLCAMAQLPTNAHGKVDRERLRQMWTEGRAVVPRERAGGAPRDELYSAWERILGHADFGDQDDFFDVGGNSLNVAQLATLLERSFGLRIELEALFSASSVAAQAGLLTQLSARGAHAVPPEAAVDRRLSTYPYLLLFRGVVSEAELREAFQASFELPDGTSEACAVRVARGLSYGELEQDESAAALRGTLASELERAQAVASTHVTLHSGRRSAVVVVRRPARLAHLDAVTLGAAGLSPASSSKGALTPASEATLVPLRDAAFSMRGAVQRAVRLGSARASSSVAGEPLEPRARERAVTQIIGVCRALESSTGGTSSFGTTFPRAGRSRSALPFEGIARFHGNCLLGTIEAYCRTVFGHVGHDRVGGEHGFVRLAGQPSAPCLTHVEPDFGLLRERLRRHHGVRFTRRAFEGSPFEHVERRVAEGHPVIVDFDFTHLPHRREYDGAPSYHPVVVVGVDFERLCLLVHEQTTGQVLLPFADCAAYFHAPLPNGALPGELRCELEAAESRALDATSVIERLDATTHNLLSPDPRYGVSALRAVVAELAPRAATDAYHVDGLWAFSHDLYMLERFLRAAERDLGIALVEAEDFVGLASLQAAWHRVDTLFEGARLTQDPLASRAALDTMSALVDGELRLARALRAARERLASRATSALA